MHFLSWWFSRWMGGRLYHVLTSFHDTTHRIKTAFLHGLADIVLACIFFAGLAWVLGFAFEFLNLWANLEQVNLWDAINETGYVAKIRDDPFGAGLWITVMLFSTLIPTVIHLCFVLAAFVPMILLPDQKRLLLADNLEAFADAPSDKPLDPKSIDIISKAAAYASGYRRRLITSNLAAVSLLLGVITLFISVHWSFGLHEFGFWAGISGIECARWVWGNV